MKRLNVCLTVLAVSASAWADGMRPAAAPIERLEAPQVSFEDFAGRGDTIFYSNAGGPYFTIGGTPTPSRFHFGQFISFQPQHNDVTDVLIDTMRVPAWNTHPTGSRSGRVNVRIYDVADPNANCFPHMFDPTAIVGNFEFPVTLAANAATIFTVDLSTLPDGGVLIPNGNLIGIEYRYLNNTGNPHPTITTLFAANLANPDDPNSNCTDPNQVPAPTVGSVADVAANDFNSDLVLTVGDINGCAGTPNELFFFGGCPFWATLMCEMTGRLSGPTGCPNPGCDDVGADADFDGNCQINLTDLGILLANFGGPATNATGDANGDGQANLTDLGILLARFGSNCN
jgi:hypothetical protein